MARSKKRPGDILVLADEVPNSVLEFEALRTAAEIDAACKRFAGRTALLANMVEGGQTPLLSAADTHHGG